MQRRGKRKSQQLRRTTYSERPSSEEVLDAVAVKRRQRQSSWEERQDLQQSLGMGSRERRPWTRRQTCFMRPAQAREGAEERPHQQHKAPPGQSCRRVCVERCPLIMRHVPTRSGDSCGSESTRARPHGSITIPSFGPISLIL